MDKVGLSFCEFYDSLFELIDNGVKSRKYYDYVLAIKTLSDAQKSYNIKLESMQFSDIREPYHDWMHALLGTRTPERVLICNE
jgi:hypothetical protein